MRSNWPQCNVESRQAYSMVECSDERMKTWFRFLLQFLKFLNQVFKGLFALAILFVLIIDFVIIMIIVIVVVTRDSLVVIASSCTHGNFQSVNNSLIACTVMLIDGLIAVQTLLNTDVLVPGHGIPLLIWRLWHLSSGSLSCRTWWWGPCRQAHHGILVCERIRQVVLMAQAKYRESNSEKVSNNFTRETVQSLCNETQHALFWMILGSSLDAALTKLVPTTDFPFLIANACFCSSQNWAARDLFSFHNFKFSRATLFAFSFSLELVIVEVNHHMPSVGVYT